MKYAIDARQAEAGARQFVRAVQTIRAQSKANIRGTADDFKELTRAVGGADFTKIARQLRSLAGVRFSNRGMTAFVRDLAELSRFKGPSASAITRVRNMAKAVTELGKVNGGKGGDNLRRVADAAMSLDKLGGAAQHLRTLKTAVTGIASLKPQGLEKLGLFFQMLRAFRVSPDIVKLSALGIALKTIRPPTDKQIGRMARFFDILKRVVVPRGLGSGLMSLGTSFKTFRPPTTSQIERFKEFMAAINGVKLRKDFGVMAAGLDRITAASSRAARGFGLLRRGMTNLPIGRTTRQVHGLTHSLRGLENAFSFSYHAGSLFRTMLGSLALGSIARSIYDTSVMYLKADSALKVVTGSQEAANAEMDQAIAMIQRTGGAIDAVLPRYSKFVAAAGQSGLTVGEARDIFEATSGALTVLGANAEDSELAFLAIEQIVSKGVLSSEELRRQLAERLPGAFQAMAKALYPTLVATEGMEAAQAKLNEELKAGSIQSVEAMQRFAEVLKETYGPELENALKRPDVALNRLRNEWTFFKKTVADSGFLYELGIAFDKLVVAMQTDEFKAFAVQLGQGLGRAVRMGADALVWMIENMEKVREALKRVIVVVIAYKALHLGANIIQSAANIGVMASGLVNLAGKFRAAAAGANFLKIALISTGIGAIVVALGTLAALLYVNRNRMIEIGGHAARLGTIMKVVWEDIVGAVSAAIEWIDRFTFTLLDIVPFARPVFEFLKGALERAGYDFSSFGSLIWSSVKTPINLVMRGFDLMATTVKAAILSMSIEFKAFIETLQNPLNFVSIRQQATAAQGRLAGLTADRMESIAGRDYAQNFVDNTVGNYAVSVAQRSEQRERTQATLAAGIAHMTGRPQTTPDAETSNLRLFTDDYDGSGRKDAQKELTSITKLIEQTLPMKTAREELAVAEERLLKAREDHLINDEQLRQAQINLRREYEAQIDPVGALVAETERNITALRETMDMSPGMQRYYEVMAELRRENAEAQAEENAELAEKLRLEESLKRFGNIRDNLDPSAAARRDYDLDRQAVLDATQPGASRDRMLSNLDAQYRDALDPRNAVTGYRELAQQLDPLAAATEQYEKELDTLNRAQQAGILVGDEYRAAVEKLNREHQDALDPVRKMREEYAEQGMILRMSDRTARRYEAVRDQINKLEEAGVTITRDLVEEVTRLVAAQDQLENPQGFRKWVDEARDLNEAMSDLAVTISDELAASFGKLFATGDFELTEFLTAIRDESAQAAGELFTKQLYQVVGLGDKGGLMGAAKDGVMSLFDGVQGNTISSIISGYNKEKAPNGLSKGDTAIVEKLIEIRDALTGGGSSAPVMGANGAKAFNNGGIFGGIISTVGSFFDNKQGNSSGQLLSTILGGEGENQMFAEASSQGHGLCCCDDEFTRGDQAIVDQLFLLRRAFEENAFFGGSSAGVAANAGMFGRNKVSSAGQGGMLLEGPDTSTMSMGDGAGYAAFGDAASSHADGDSSTGDWLQTAGTTIGAIVGAYYGNWEMGAQIGNNAGTFAGGIADMKDPETGAIKYSSNPIVAAIQQQTQIIVDIGKATIEAIGASGGGGGGMGGMGDMFGGMGGMGGGSSSSTSGAKAQKTGSSTGGGGGGGFWSSAGSFFSGFFEEGGYSTEAVKHGLVPASAFLNAPRYAMGTASTSSGERPAVLHDDEAVIPLSRGRYVPVQMEGGGGSSQVVNQNVTFNVNAEDPNAFRRSEHQLRARAVRSLRSAA
jgi:tape measure domain-containing protein